jgi:hypothetical protein
MEHEEQAERMAHDADQMEEHSDKVGERIEEIRDDWERKEQDAAVPGARPDPDAEQDEEPVAGVNADEEVVSEEGGP